MRPSQPNHQGIERIEVLALDEEGQDSHDSNLDVYVILKNGERWGATFFTLKNLESTFGKNQRTGEEDAGRLFWCPDMVIVRENTRDNIARSIEYLASTGELLQAFQHYPEE